MNYPQEQHVPTFSIGHLDRSLLSKLSPEDREITTQDNPEGAIEVCSALITRHPENASVYLCRGNAYQDLGRFPEAVSDFSKGIELSSKGEISIRLYESRSYSLAKERKFDEALADLEKLVVLSEKVEPNDSQRDGFLLDRADSYVHAQRGYIHFCQWKLEQAVADCTRVIESSRQSLQKNTAYSIRVNVFIFLERFDEAEKDCREMLSHAREYGWGDYEFIARTNLAWLLLRRKDYDSAATEIMQTLKEDVNHPLTKINLGDLFLGLNCKESAVEQYAEVFNHIYETGCVDIDDYLTAIHVNKRLDDLRRRTYQPNYQKEAAEKGFIPLEISDRYLKFIQR